MRVVSSPLVMLPLVALAACWAPRDTSSTSMAGRLVDAEGAPVVGQRVFSIEARDTTDEEGRFAVNFKAPDQWIYLQRDGLWLQRDYTPEDDGTIVEVTLPALEERSLVCRGVAFPCEAELNWQLDPHTKARVTATCDPDGGPVAVQMLPGQPTTSVCRASSAAEPVAVDTWDEGEELRLTPPAHPVQFVLSAEPRPTSCEVRTQYGLLDGTPRSGWATEAWGPLQVTGQCDGVPFVPRSFFVAGPHEAALDWSADAPWFGLLGRAAWATGYKITKVTGRDRGWKMEIPRREDGGFQLPPLGAGAYVLSLNADWDFLARAHPDPNAAAGKIAFVELPAQDADGNALVVGSLVVGEDTVDGRVPIVWHDAREAGDL